jgi:hypothetical protein
LNASAKPTRRPAPTPLAPVPVPISLSAPVSVGDLLDRMTILAIKCEKLESAEARRDVGVELAQLTLAWNEAALPAPDTLPEFAELSAINRQLWEVEDRLRAAEAASRFDDAFIADARSVYRINDRRAEQKRSLNLRFDSALVERKQHPRY